MNHPMHFEAGRATSLHEALYRRLMRPATGDINDRFIAQMLAGWLAARGALPRHMGLGAEAFAALCERHFPGLGRLDNGARHEPDAARAQERADVRDLLLGDRAGRTDSELAIAELVAVGCLAADHLWSDLGLFSRTELSAMLALNFPALVARNDRNMKWKKFFYKQLCAQEGIYLCRSPSCEVCKDYQKCFVVGGE